MLHPLKCTVEPAAGLASLSELQFTANNTAVSAAKRLACERRVIILEWPGPGTQTSADT